MLDEIVNLYGIVIGEMLIIASLYKLYNKKLDLKDKYFYIGTLIYVIFQVILDQASLINLKPFLGFLCLIFICWLIFKKDIIQSIVSTIFIYVIMLLSEIIIIVLISFIAKATSTNSLTNILNLLESNVFFSFLINFGFATLLYAVCSINNVKRLHSYIKNFIYQKKFKKYYKLVALVFVLLIVSFQVICLSDSLVTKVSIYFFLLSLTTYVILSNLKISTEYDKAKEKYATTSNSLIEYEGMIDKYRVNNHENKNQLQMIRSMIKQKDKSTGNYIDNLLDTVYMANEALMMDVSIIPAGGLRATIYSKLVLMDNNHIRHTLNIDHKLRDVSFFENNLKITLKICNLLSIFIDNAIEEVNLQKNKIINIDIYLDDQNTVAFEITNKYVTKFDIEKIHEKKYTTKSRGHGYGLTLAKEIIESELRINNKTIVENNLFTQILIIDVKNKSDKI